MNASAISFPTFHRLWRSLPRVLNNPIILRETLVRMRTKVGFAYLGLMLAVSFICILLFWSDMTRYSIYVDRNYQIRTFFMMVNFFQGLTVACLVPLMSATIINNERERETWDLLITTPLNLASIVAGKFISAVLFVWLMLFSLAPVYGIFFLTGGISAKEILFVFAMITEVTIVIGLIGLLCSIQWKRTITAVSAAYILGAGYLIGVPLGRVFLANLIFGDAEPGVEILVSPVLIGVFFFMNQMPPVQDDIGKWFYRHPYTTHTLLVCIAIAVLWFLCMALLMRKGESGPTLADRIRRWRRAAETKPKGKEFGFVPDGANAVYHKDTIEISRKLWYRLGNALLFLFIVFVFFQTMRWGADDMAEWAKALMSFALFIPLFVFPYASNAVRYEYDRNTIDLLRTTTLTDRDILRGKYRAGLDLVFTRMMYFVLPVFCWIMILLCLPKTWDTGAMEISVGACITCIAAAFFFLSVGMFFSTFCRKTTAAYALTFGTGLLIYFGSILFLVLLGEGLGMPSSIRNTVLYPIIGAISPVFNYISYNQKYWYSSSGYGMRSHFVWSGELWWSILVVQAGWMVLVSFIARLFTHDRFSQFDR